MSDDFTGFQRLSTLLQGYIEKASPENILRAQASGAEYFCDVMRGRSSPRGRRRPGMLDSVDYEQDPSKTETLVGWKKFYGRLVESGHRAGGWAKAKKVERVAGRAHMKPEFESQKEQIVSRMVAVLRGD